MGFSKIESSTKPWAINDRELGYNLEKTPKSFGRTQDLRWKIYVPKIMPLIPMDVPKEVKETMDDSVFLNAKACKPSLQKTIITQNYITVNRPPNRAFKYAWKKHGMKLEIEVSYRNIDLLRVDNTVDNSSPQPK